MKGVDWKASKVFGSRKRLAAVGSFFAAAAERFARPTKFRAIEIRL